MSYFLGALLAVAVYLAAKHLLAHVAAEALNRALDIRAGVLKEQIRVVLAKGVEEYEMTERTATFVAGYRKGYERRRQGGHSEFGE